MGSSESGYRALKEDVVAVRTPRDAVAVTGPDALTFLQGQLSQDVEALGDGASARSLILGPEGRIDAWVRVTRLSPDEYVLDVDGGYGERVIDRLGRFKLRVDCRIERLDWQCIALRGPRSAASGTGRARIAPLVDWAGAPGVDLLGPELDLPPDVPLAGIDVLETARIEAGVPAMGSELTDRTIPAEAGVVAESVSFTKGCFVGQELVARIDSRGARTPRQLRGVVTAAGVQPPVGARLLADGREVGNLTSVAVSPVVGAAVALAFVRREVELPAEAEISWDRDLVPASIRELPLAPLMGGQ